MGFCTQHGTWRTESCKQKTRKLGTDLRVVDATHVAAAARVRLVKDVLLHVLLDRPLPRERRGAVGAPVQEAAFAGDGALAACSARRARLRAEDDVRDGVLGDERAERRRDGLEHGQGLLLLRYGSRDSAAAGWNGHRGGVHATDGRGRERSSG